MTNPLDLVRCFIPGRKHLLASNEKGDPVCPTCRSDDLVIYIPRFIPFRPLISETGAITVGPEMACVNYYGLVPVQAGALAETLPVVHCLACGRLFCYSRTRERDPSVYMGAYI